MSLRARSSMSAMALRWRVCAWAVIGGCGLWGSGCASTSVATPAQISDRVKQETGHPIREALAEPRVPPGVSLEDGLTPDEAAATALWNSPSFQESLADLDIARADVVQAGLLRNPLLTLFLPWGPKQL